MVNSFDRRLRQAEETTKSVQDQQVLLQTENAKLRAEADQLKLQQADDRTQTKAQLDTLTEAQKGLARVLSLLTTLPSTSTAASNPLNPMQPEAMNTGDGAGGV